MQHPLCAMEEEVCVQLLVFDKQRRRNHQRLWRRWTLRVTRVALEIFPLQLSATFFCTLPDIKPFDTKVAGKLMMLSQTQYE